MPYAVTPAGGKEHLIGKVGEVDQVALEQRLRRFCDTYYAELRRRMAEYPAASDIFPYYLAGFRRIVATLTLPTAHMRYALSRC